jgi:hypothetical protein
LIAVEAAMRAVEGPRKLAMDVRESVARAAASSGPRFVPDKLDAGEELLVPSVTASAVFEEVLTLWRQHDLLILSGTPGSVRQRSCRHTALFLPRSVFARQACTPARTLSEWSAGWRQGMSRFVMDLARRRNSQLEQVRCPCRSYVGQHASLA